MSWNSCHDSFQKGHWLCSKRNIGNLPCAKRCHQWVSDCSFILSVRTRAPTLYRQSATTMVLTGTLTHWGRMTHICVGKLTIIGSDNGLSPGRRQAIMWINVGLLLIRNLGTNFSEILIGVKTFSFKKMHLKMSSGKWRPFCLGLNVLTTIWKLILAVITEFTSSDRWIPHTRLNKRLSKQRWGWWFETPLRPLWRHLMLSAINRDKLS